MAEAEFNSAQELAAYAGPSFSIREVSDDPRFTGAQLVRYGIPAEPAKTPSNQIGGLPAQLL